MSQYSDDAEVEESMEPGWQPSPDGLDRMDPIDRTRRISLGQIHPARINTKILTNMITQVFHSGLNSKRTV